jgi:hypothetical protein
MNFSRILGLSVLLSSIGLAGYAQRSPYAEAGVGFGASTISPVVALHKDWSLDKKSRFLIGSGVRFTGFYANNVTLTSAPPNLARDPASVDTLFAPAPNINALNLLITLAVNVSPKIQLGFSIDALGFSFGPTGKPDFVASGNRSTVSASPTRFNVLLIDNNDIGSLGSYIFGRYRFSNKVGIKLAYQHLFNELTTTTTVQTIPEANDRFRVKSNLAYLGIQYHF